MLSWHKLRTLMELGSYTISLKSTLRMCNECEDIQIEPPPHLLVSQANPPYENIEKESGQKPLSRVSPVHHMVHTNHVRASGHMTL